MKVNALNYSHLSEPEMMFGRRGSPDNFLRAIVIIVVVILHSIVKINKNNQRYIYQRATGRRISPQRAKSNGKMFDDATQSIEEMNKQKNFIDIP